MKKFIKDFTILSNEVIGDGAFSLMKLTPSDGSCIPETRAGQFVQVAVPEEPKVFLRRPISINRIDREANTLWLLIRRAGNGTEHLISMAAGSVINIILPLGNGFPMPDKSEKRLLLVGGGVGIAPLLQLCIELQQQGFSPEFLVGARREADILELEILESLATVHIATDDGSRGVHGVVTDHPVMKQGASWDRIYCCGPAPMMKAVARQARQLGAKCLVSLENMMACGVGACLCCVERTVKGNVCVCTEGPVFDIDQLTW